jgi:tetratricopeptide (TPR) repeat protein
LALFAAETDTGRGGDSLRHAEALLGRLDDRTPASLRAQALWAIASTYLAQGRTEEAMALLTNAINAFSSGEDLVTWARLRLAIVLLRQRPGQTLDAEDAVLFSEMAKVLRLTGVPVHQAKLDVIEAQIAIGEERFTEARNLCEAALARADLLSFRERVQAQMLLGVATARTDDVRRAVTDLRELAQRLDEAGARDLSAEAWRLVAELVLTDREGR